MKPWWNELDRLLRGEVTRPSALRWGGIELHVGRLAAMSVALGLISPVDLAGLEELDSQNAGAVAKLMKGEG